MLKIMVKQLKNGKDEDKYPNKLEINLHKKWIDSFIDCCETISVSDRPFLNDARFITICNHTFIVVDKEVSEPQCKLEYLGFHWLVYQRRIEYEKYYTEGNTTDALTQSFNKNSYDVIISIKTLRMIAVHIFICEIWHMIYQDEEAREQFKRLNKHDIGITVELKEGYKERITVRKDELLIDYEKACVKYYKDWNEVGLGFKY